MKNTIKANLVKNTDSGLVTSVSGAVFVLAFWDSKPCFLTSILPKFYPLVRLPKEMDLLKLKVAEEVEQPWGGTICPGWTNRRGNFNGVFTDDFEALYLPYIAGSNFLCDLSNPGKMSLPNQKALHELVARPLPAREEGVAVPLL